MQARLIPGFLNKANPVVVDPLPEDISIEATTTPGPEEKNFADYILIIPISDIPPIYIYLNTNHKYYTPPKENPPLSAFPYAKKMQAKTPVKGEVCLINCERGWSRGAIKPL